LLDLVDWKNLTGAVPKCGAALEFFGKRSSLEQPQPREPFFDGQRIKEIVDVSSETLPLAACRIIYGRFSPAVLLAKRLGPIRVLSVFFATMEWFSVSVPLSTNTPTIRTGRIV